MRGLPHPGALRDAADALAEPVRCGEMTWADTIGAAFLVAALVAFAIIFGS